MTADRIAHLEAELARQASAKAEAQTAREYAVKQVRKARRERDRLAAVVARVEATLDAVDETKSATVMVSAVRRALDGPALDGCGRNLPCRHCPKRPR